MKPRHIAAFALLGWYLIAPPPVRDTQGKESGKVSDWLPLAEWENLGPFNTARECQEYRADQISWLLKNPELRRSQSLEEQHRLDAHKEQLNQSQCIATDDPRLKENK